MRTITVRRSRPVLAIFVILAWLIVVPIGSLLSRIRPSDREALGLGLIAWLLLMLALVVTFPKVWH